MSGLENRSDELSKKMRTGFRYLCSTSGGRGCLHGGREKLRKVGKQLRSAPNPPIKFNPADGLSLSLKLPSWGLHNRASEVFGRESPADCRHSPLHSTTWKN